MLTLLNIVQSARDTARAARAFFEASEARGRMALPPTCKWELEANHQYCAFLSHYKVEAGSDARCAPPALKH
eukprot:2009257-Prymnesium_polylepis.3